MARALRGVVGPGHRIAIHFPMLELFSEQCFFRFGVLPGFYLLNSTHAVMCSRCAEHHGLQYIKHSYSQHCVISSAKVHARHARRNKCLCTNLCQRHICVYIYIYYIDIDTYVHTYIHSLTHTHTNTHVHTPRHTMRNCMTVYGYSCLLGLLCTCTHACICTCMCMHRWHRCMWTHIVTYGRHADVHT